MMLQRYRTSRLSLLLAIVLVGAFTLTGCASLSNTEKGAATGAGAGAVVGGVIGKATGNTAKGAILGAVVGGSAGAIIGQQMDKQAQELDQELEGAEVARVGEGIQVTFDNAILFDFDSADLRYVSRDDLNALYESLQDYPGTEILIVGHTDSKGSDEYNQRLSERRAESAASYLMQRGLAPSRVTTLGKGERDPVSDNASEYGRQQNRRVEIAIYASDEYREELQRRQGR